MKLRYFFTPIRDMFNFSGKATRAEFFTYAIPSALIGFLVILIVLVEPIIQGFDWHALAPAIFTEEMMNERGYLWDPISIEDLVKIFYIGLFITQFPMIALSVRRLNDQYAAWHAYIWLFVPFIGPFALFFYAFVPTFVDRQVTVDGVTMMRSEQLSHRRRRNTVIGGLALVGGAAAISSALTVPDMKLEGGKKVRTNPKNNLWNSDGTPNRRNNILGRTKAHVSGGRSVKGYGTKRKM